MLVEIFKKLAFNLHLLKGQLVHIHRGFKHLKQQPVPPAQSGVISVVEEAKQAKVEKLNLSGWGLISIPEPIDNSTFTEIVFI